MRYLGEGEDPSGSALSLLHEMPLEVVLLQRLIFAPLVELSALLSLGDVVESDFVLEAVLDVLQLILELNCECSLL